MKHYGERQQLPRDRRLEWPKSTTKGRVFLRAIIVSSSLFVVVACSASQEMLNYPVENLAPTGDSTFSGEVYLEPCAELSSLDIDESQPDRIVITAVVLRDTTDCDGVGVATTVRGSTQAPIGTRRLVSP